MAELLPCPTPFCSEPEPFIERVGSHLFAVRCKYCGVKTEAQYTEACAVEQWNTRPQSTSNETLLHDALSKCRQRLLGHPSIGDVIACLNIIDAALQSIPEPLSTGEFEIEGSIYDNMAAAMSRNDKTIAHFLNYGDCVEVVGRLNAKSEPLSDEGLVEALKPFADAYDECFDDEDNDKTTIWESGASMLLTVGHLRQAHAALSIPRLEAGRVTEAMIEAGARAFRHAHQCTCYPDAEDWECVDAAKRIFASMSAAMSSTSAPDGED